MASIAVAGVGLGALAVPAFASTSPSIKLTMVDDDTVAVSGRYFPANSQIAVEAKTPAGHGKGSIKSGPDGRILLGFRLANNFSGHIDVVATGAPPASVDVDGTTAGRIPPAPAVTTTTAPAPAAGTDSDTGTTSAPTPTQAASTGTVVGMSDALTSIPNAAALQSKIVSYNSQINATNALVGGVNARLKALGPLAPKYNAQVATMNGQFKTLNQQVTEANTLMTKLNDKAKTATGADLAPLVAQLNTSYATVLVTTAQVGISVKTLATTVGATASTDAGGGRITA